MLSGVRILDLTDERGHLTGKILGDLGADVIKVEPIGGDPLRAQGPFLDGGAGVDRSLRWLALNTSKRSIVLDLAGNQEDRECFRDLAASADVILETAAPGELEALGLGPEQVRAELPGLIWCSITPFGRSGPYAGYRAHDLVVVAMGGNAAMTGEPDQAPLRCTGPTSSIHACPEAAAAVAVGLLARERNGRGDHIDVSMQECQLGTLLGGVGQFVLGSRAPKRMGARIGRTREIWRTLDGWITFGLRGGPARVKSLIATSEYMGECDMQPAWLRDYDWERYNHNTLGDEDLERFEAALGAFFAMKTMRELYEQAIERRIMLAPCNDAREIVEHVQLRARELFVDVERPDEEASLEHVGFFAKSDAGGIGIRTRAPRLDEHGAELRLELAAGEPASATNGSAGAVAASASAPIFEGLNILEFGSGVAGPAATRYFTDHGATVVRVESTDRPDFLRLLHLTRDDPHGLDGAPMFILLNPNKRSVTLNLAEPAAVALVTRLVEWADVVSENFAPGVMDRWGLGAQTLRGMKPALITVSGCLFGQTGPQRSYPGFGGQGAAIAGFNHLTGCPDAEALGPYGTITDSLAPRYIGLLIAAALRARDRTGQGRSIDVSQIETGVYSLSEMILRYTAAGETMTRMANHDERAVPHSIYPCRGDDRWIAIAVWDDEQWAALLRVMTEVDGEGSQDPEAALRAEGLGTTRGRRDSQDRIDEAIAQWTVQHDAHDLMTRLQAAGVEAGVVQTFADLLDDPQLAHREHFRRLHHVHLGEVIFDRLGFRLSGHPDRLLTPGPNIGEHNREVLGEILGLDDDEIAQLAADGVVR